MGRGLSLMRDQRSRLNTQPNPFNCIPRPMLPEPFKGVSGWAAINPPFPAINGWSTNAGDAQA